MGWGEAVDVTWVATHVCSPSTMKLRFNLTKLIDFQKNNNLLVKKEMCTFHMSRLRLTRDQR